MEGGLHGPRYLQNARRLEHSPTLDTMIENIGNYNKRCAKAYRKAAEQLKEKILNNDHYYDDFLKNILDNF